MTLRAGGMAWGEQLARAARRRPERAAVVHRGGTITYADLAARMEQVAAGLAARGIGRGDRVALLMRNRPEFLEACLGALRLGAIVVPVNFRMVAAEVGFVLADSGARILLVDPPGSAVAAHAASAAPALGDVVTVEAEGAQGYASLPGAPLPEPPAVAESEPALIMYTSGTTGRPKGAVLSHQNLVMASVSALMAKGTGRDDEVIYLNLPLFHVGGLKMALSALMCEASMVLVESGRFNAAEAVDDLERHGCTDCCFVGMQWREICALPGISERRLALRRLAWGTQTADLETLEAIRRTFPGIPVNVSFGQTEMAGLTCRLNGEDFERKRGSVGRPVPHVEARIVDDRMRDVAVGEVGEIVYRGPALMLGYWNLPEADAAAFAGDWFHSGDLCRFDEDGFVYVVDRITDTIVSGGENIYSAAVEEAIAGHPGVAEVAVIAAPHPRWGESPLAVIVPRDAAHPPDLDDIVAHCRERIAAYRAPTRLEVVDALPRNASGKVVKPLLRERFVAAATQPVR
ncbi:MAG: long-chain fatty acid--CoA ligase [Chloroflexi bacterium]|nr:MAG: long-chain fatty acid--CoA ligase [Chloroflexota bacterium]